MKTSLVLAILTLAAFLTASAAPQQSGVPAGVHYTNHDDAALLIAKNGANNMVHDPGLNVGTNRRGAGAIEYHDRNNHIFIIIDGEATFIVGGTMVNPKRTSPDQMTADSIEGGVTYHLTKGDVITVPAKVPHWFKEVPTKTIVYYLVNIESQQ